MIEYIEAIAGYLSEAQNEFPVVPGYIDAFSHTPQELPEAFVTAEKADAESLAFKVTIFTPAEEEGLYCEYRAELLMQLLAAPSCPLAIGKLSMGAVRYVADSMSFSACVTGELTLAQTHSFTADGFENDPMLHITSEIPSYRIIRTFNTRPVMTFLSEAPFAVHDGMNTYEITLFGVPGYYIGDISGNGVFRLTVDGELFSRCRCVKCVCTQESVSDLTIEAWEPRDREEEVPVPVPTEDF